MFKDYLYEQFFLFHCFSICGRAYQKASTKVDYLDNLV